MFEGWEQKLQQLKGHIHAQVWRYAFKLSLIGLSVLALGFIYHQIIHFGVEHRISLWSHKMVMNLAQEKGYEQLLKRPTLIVPAGTLLTFNEGEMAVFGEDHYACHGDSECRGLIIGHENEFKRVTLVKNGKKTEEVWEVNGASLKASEPLIRRVALQNSRP